jgi:hypothetical protein
MKYKTEIVVPITLAKNVETIEFKSKVLASLDCFGCKRSGRTVVLFENQAESFCTPTRHEFPGHIDRIEISDREKIGLISTKSVVTATYFIEYEFQEFTDKKYPQREISPIPTWGRATFILSCKCGEKSEHETQNNTERPWKAVCKCGKDLYYEVDETPIFRNTAKA